MNLETAPGQGTPQETITCYGAAIADPSCTDDGYHTYPLWTKNILDATTTPVTFHLTGYTYDYALGVPLSETDLNGVPTNAEYDGFGRMLKLIRHGDSTSSPTVQISYHDTAEKFYTEASQKLDDSTHFIIRKFYDGLGRSIQTQIVGAEVNGNSGQTIVSNTSYSVVSGTGQQVEQTVPFTVNGDCGGYCNLTTTDKTTTQYDALGRVLWVKEPQDTNPNAYAVQNSYTVNTGNCLFAAPGDTSPNRPCAITSSTDRSGTTTQSLSSARGLTGRVHPAAGPDVDYFYDAAGRLTTARYGSASTSLTYDLAGRKTSMTDPDMGHWTYSYDALGNLTGQTDARACTTSLTYDNLNRLTGKSYTGTCSSTPAVSYTYDEFNVEGDIDNNGYRTGMNDANSGTTWRYDSRGRLETKTQNITGSGSFQTQWAYNSADQVTSMIYPDGEVLANTYLPQMTLDTMIGTISGVNTTYVSDSKYDATGKITTRVFNTSNFRQVYSYVPWAGTGGGSLDTIKAGTNASSYNNILNLDYTYDVDGNITSIYDGKLLNTQTFTYDALNRLTSTVATGGASAYALENTTYNATTGNLASKAGISYTYADTAHKHAVTSLSNGNAYTYDANGNQVTRKVGSVTHTLTYDGENRLTKVMNGSTTIATFVYDADGQRVKSTLNGVTTTFVGNYYEKTGTNITKYYYAGAARVAMRNTSVKYLFGDQLGSTSVTTSSSGVIGSQERYKPFGEMYYTSGTLPTRYIFTGQYSYTINTNEIGLLYYGARFYDPLLGRFAQADTIIPGAGNPQSWDRYSYTNNNPTKYTDPSGHFATLATAFAGAAIGFAIDAGFQLIPQLLEGKAITECEYSIAQGAGAAAGGFVGGLTLGIGSGIIALAATGTTSVTGAAAIVTGAMAGGAANALGNQTGALVQGAIETDSPLFSTTAINQAARYGYGDMNQMLTDTIIGTITGGLTSIKFPAGNKISMIERSYSLDPGGSKWVSKTLTSKLGNEVRTIVPAAKKGAFYRAVTDFGNWVSEGINQAVK